MAKTSLNVFLLIQPYRRYLKEKSNTRRVTTPTKTQDINHIIANTHTHTHTHTHTYTHAHTYRVSPPTPNKQDLAVIGN